jgi:hypothetical protein
MAAKKIKKAKKVRTEEDAKLMKLMNEVAEMCRDCQEVGSPPSHKVVEMQGNLWRLANSKGYEREHYWGDFT